MSLYKTYRKRILIVSLLTTMLVYPNYFFGAIGVLIAVLVLGLFVLDIVLDVYIIGAYFVEWYRERFRRDP